MTSFRLRAWTIACMTLGCAFGFICCSKSETRVRDAQPGQTNAITQRSGDEPSIPDALKKSDEDDRPDAIFDPPILDKQSAEITGSNAVFRATPAMSGETLGEIKEGSWVEILGKSDQPETVGERPFYWYKARSCHTGEEGWLYGECLAFDYGIAFENAKPLHGLAIASDLYLDRGGSEVFYEKPTEPYVSWIYEGSPRLIIPVTEQNEARFADTIERGMITLIARQGTKEYTVTVLLEHSETMIEYGEGTTGAYYADFSFEPKFWECSSDDWVLLVGDETNTVFQMAFPCMRRPVLYRASSASESPFDCSDTGPMERNVRYLYRFQNDGNQVLVVYYYVAAERLDKPILVLRSDSIRDCTISLTWTDAAPSGEYRIKTYAIDSLPKKLGSVDIFERNLVFLD